VAVIFTVGPVKQNKDRSAWSVDILGPLGPTTFVSSNLFTPYPNGIIFFPQYEIDFFYPYFQEIFFMLELN
jgi:hypothetical protein